MLTCYGHEIRLPNNDLAYLAFRLAAQETLSDIELYRDLEEEPDYPAGYLSEVPFLEQVPLKVQVDLLAETWNRHQQTELIEASLLDAAIIYAACQTTARIIEDMPEVAAAYFRDGPRQLKTRILHRATHRLENLFDAFWDDDDFLLLDPEDAAWVVDADDEDLPALVFGNPEEAYVAYLRSCAVGDARERRREEALKRLGRV